ncbi:unnamed protein product [Linum tenue]|uniref:GATA transcription factor n=1 Tax=Linum tenue TaxID=586396 RepID=A0AAV0GYZ8_9ROSI|nr:unnamed protein product [Linum tenue]CAI0558055.1 unnamed protein product [Linum tenue]
MNFFLFPSIQSLPPSFSEMEFYCMEDRALKSSLRREVMASVKYPQNNQLQQDLGFEDFLCLNPSSAEDFSVDCFLDFSNGGFKDEEEPAERLEEEEEEEQDSVSVSNSSSASFSDSLLSSDLPVHAEDLAELEWVSQFVDDSSSSSEAAALFAAVSAEKPFEFKPTPAKTPVFTTLPPPPFLTSRVPARTRTKRARTAGASWFNGSSVISDSSSLTYSPTSSSSAASSAPYLNSLQIHPSISSLFPRSPGEPLRKKQKKRLPATAGESGSNPNPTQQQRRCSHCGIQKTPQWRSGPNGAKTLCNACGVRFKSGRLLPEYRPAGSPTFSSEVHSNSHRKVLEMRKKKEQVEESATATEPAAGSDLTRVVPGF